MIHDLLAVFCLLVAFWVFFYVLGSLIIDALKWWRW